MYLVDEKIEKVVKIFSSSQVMQKYSQLLTCLACWRRSSETASWSLLSKFEARILHYFFVKPKFANKTGSWFGCLRPTSSLKSPFFANHLLWLTLMCKCAPLPRLCDSFWWRDVQYLPNYLTHCASLPFEVWLGPKIPSSTLRSSFRRICHFEKLLLFLGGSFRGKLWHVLARQKVEPP